MKHLFALCAFFLTSIAALQVSPPVVHEAEAFHVKMSVAAYVRGSDRFQIGLLSVGSEAGLEFGTASPRDIVWRAIRIMASIAGTLAILLYIVGAYFIIISQGNETQFQKGRDVILYTSLGVILVFTAYIIVQFTLGIIFFAG